MKTLSRIRLLGRIRPMLAWTGAILLGATACPGVSRAVASQPSQEMQRRDSWLQQHGLGPGQPAAPGGCPAFSFLFGGQPSDKLLATCPRKCQTGKLSQGRTQHALTWTDVKTGLEVRCVTVEYADFPALEWTVYFKNAGPKDTPLLADLQAIDARLERGEQGEYLLKYHKGDTCAADLYQPLQQTLLPKSELRLAPVGGRGTNHAFPYSTARVSWPVVCAFPATTCGEIRGRCGCVEDDTR